jgi:hypothetical protein
VNMLSGEDSLFNPGFNFISRPPTYK